MTLPRLFFEPLFALLRAVFANTDVWRRPDADGAGGVCHAAAIAVAAIPSGLLLARRERSFRNFLNRPDPLTGFRLCRCCRRHWAFLAPLAASPPGWRIWWQRRAPASSSTRRTRWSAA